MALLKRVLERSAAYHRDLIIYVYVVDRVHVCRSEYLATGET